MSGGYIRLHRGIVNSDVWNSGDNVLRAFLYYLTRANWRQHTYKGRVVQPGQLVGSWDRMAAAAGMTGPQLRRATARLENMHVLSREGGRFGVLITIKNWATYQGRDDQPVTKPAPQPAPSPYPIKEEEETGATQFGLFSDEPRSVRADKKARDRELGSRVQEVVSRFNEVFGRRLGTKAYTPMLGRLFAAGHTVEECRAVIWWAQYEWPEGHEYRPKLSPATLFKLKGANRTFPVYLDLASDAWRETSGKEPPWIK